MDRDAPGLTSSLAPVSVPRAVNEPRSDPNANGLSALELFADEPSTLEADDFGHVSYAHVLVEALASGRQPLTIGLLGPWGVGKSSVIERAGRDLKAQGAAFVRFDAWRYDDVAMRRAFLREVADQLDG